MKSPNFYLIICIVCFQFSCSKESDTSIQNTIIGTWISADKSDTLDFVDKESFYMSNANMRYDHYDYELINDSIKVEYNGRLYILVTPTIHQYLLLGDKLSIDFSNKQCYGFEFQKIDYYKKR